MKENMERQRQGQVPGTKQSYTGNVTKRNVVKCTIQRNKRTMEKRPGRDVETNSKFLRSGAIKNKEGCVLTEKEVKARGKECVENLYKDKGRRELEENITEVNGIEILHSEIRLSMKTIKKGKNVGEDEMAIEMLESLAEFAIGTLV